MSKKSRPKRVILGLGVTLILLGVTIASLPLYCSSTGFRSLLLARINRFHTGTANYAQLSVGWQKGITISDVSFHEEDGTTFTCKSIASKPKLLPLLRGYLRLGQTIIQEPSLTVDLRHLSAESPPGAEQPSAPAQSPSSALTLLGDITVSKGHIQLIDAHGQTITVSNLNALVSLKAPRRESRYQLSTTLRLGQRPPATIRATGQLTVPSTADWSLENANGTMALEVNDLDLEGLAPLLTLALITLKTQTQGLMSATIQADIQDGRLNKLAGQLRANNLVVTGPALGTDRIAARELTVNTRLSHDHEGLTLHYLQLASDLISVNAAGRIPGPLVSPNGYQINGTFTCDVAELLMQMPSTFKLKPDTRINTGKLAGRIQATGNTDRTVITSQASSSDLTGTLNTKAVQLSQPMELDLRLTRQADTITCGGHIQGAWDWTEVRDIISTYLPPELELSGQRQVDISFQSEYPITDPNQFTTRLTAQARLGFDQAHYRGLDFGSTELDLQVQNGLLTIAPFTTLVNEGRFHFAGQTDLHRIPHVFESHKAISLAQGIRLNKQCAHQLLMYVNPMFANVLDTSGVLDFECEQLTIPLTANTPEAIRVVGTVSVNDLYLEQSQLLGQILAQFGEGLRGQMLTIHPTRFTLENGLLRYDNMQVDVGDNPVNFSGTIGLDKQLHMTVTLPYTLRGRTVKTGRGLKGSRIELPLIGTVDRPELDLGSLIQNQFQNLLQDLLK